MTSAAVWSSAGAVVTVVDPRDGLARLHRLVVGDQHLGDVAGDLGGDGGVVGFHIGVVGRDLILTDLPVLVAPAGTKNAHSNDSNDKQQAPGGAASVGLGRRVGKVRITGAEKLGAHGRQLIPQIPLGRNFEAFEPRLSRSVQTKRNWT